jgi:hypothetical protein
MRLRDRLRAKLGDFLVRLGYEVMPGEEPVESAPMEIVVSKKGVVGFTGRAREMVDDGLRADPPEPEEKPEPPLRGGLEDRRARRRAS